MAAVWADLKWAATRLLFPLLVGLLRLTKALVVGQTSRSLRYRYRDQYRPVVLAGMLWLASWIASGYPLLWIVGGCLLLSAATAIYLSDKLNRSEEWVYAGICMVAATVWVPAQAAPHGRWVWYGGVLAWSALSLIWWQHHAVQDWVGVGRSVILDRWQKYVEENTKSPLPESRLHSPTPFENGMSYVLDLVPGVQTLGMVMGSLSKLETALDIPQQYLLVEKHPDHPDRPSRLRFQHVTKSPIKDTVWFDKPRHHNGRILTGPYADGIGEAYYQLYTRNSMWSGFAMGDTGSGKSRFQETIVLSVRDPDFPPTVVWYMDGQYGASSPILFDNADWAVGPDRALVMLSALERIAKQRQRENIARRLSGFTPTEERPGILVAMDEVHALFKLAAQRFADGAREWRKVGICMFAMDQGADLSQTFDGIDILRTSLQTGNCIVMRSTSRVQKHLLVGLDLDPSDLPKLPGYGIAAGYGMRTAPFRGRYAPTNEEKQEMLAEGKKVPVPTIEEWFERFPGRELDPTSAEAAGPDYANRHAQVDAEVEGNFPPSLDPGPPDGGGGMDLSAQSRCAVRILSLTWNVEEEKTTAVIIEELRREGTVSDRTVNNALKELVDSGKLEKVGHGKYKLSVKVSV